jgi:hypothetical protein
MRQVEAERDFHNHEGRVSANIVATRGHVLLRGSTYVRRRAAFGLLQN